MMLLTFVYRVCVDKCFHFSWVHIWVELLCHMMPLCLTFWGTASFQRSCTSNYEDFNFSASLLVLIVTAFFIITILVGMQWYLIVVLITIILMSNDVEHLFHVAIGLLCTFFGELPIHVLCLFQNLNYSCPGWCGSVGWMLVWDPKGLWFDSQSGHVPGLRGSGRLLGTFERQPHIDVSLPLFPSL